MTNEEAIKILKLIKAVHAYKSNNQCEAIDMAIQALKRDDPETEYQKRLTNSTIYGYSFKELIAFAYACRMKGIANEDLKDFCTNIENAYTYVTELMEEQMKTILNKQFGLKGVEHD